MSESAASERRRTPRLPRSVRNGRHCTRRTVPTRIGIGGEAVKRTKEVFAVTGEPGSILALWCSAKPQVKLEGKEWYRLDYLRCTR